MELFQKMMNMAKRALTHLKYSTAMKMKMMSFILIQPQGRIME
jgi:hypothetical protein